MATDLEKLVVLLNADIRGYQRELAKANAETVKRSRAMEREWAMRNKKIADTFGGIGRAVVGAFSVIASSQIVRGVQELIDASTRINNALKVTGLAGQDLESVYQGLYSAAQKNAVPLETLVGLYSKAALAQKELGVSSQDLISFTSNVGLALRVAGTDAQAASGALLQLGQALGSGKVQAEEFNSVLEGAPTIAQTAARGLKEAGGSVSQLKALVVDGKVSSQAFFQAFQAGAVSLEQQAHGSVMTSSQAFTQLGNSLINLAREFDQSTRVSQQFADGIGNVARAIDGFDIGGFIQKIREARDELSGFLNAVGDADIIKRFNQLIGNIDASGAVINPDVKAANSKISELQRDVDLLQKAIEQNTTMGFDNGPALQRLAEVRAELARVQAAAQGLPALVQGVRPDGSAIPRPQDNPVGTNGQMGGPSTRGGARVVAVKPVSIVDYPVTSAKEPKSRAAKSGGAARTDEYADAVKDIREQTAAIEQQRLAMTGLNGASADYEERVLAIEKAQELLTAAQKGGKEITPQLRAEIQALADNYAAASAASDRLRDSQEAQAQAAQDAIAFQKDLLNGALSDMRAGLEDGKLSWDDLKSVALNALNRIADKLQEMAVDSLFSGGGGLGSILGSFFGGAGGSFPAAPVGLYDSGGYTGAGGRKTPAGVVHKGEVVWSQKDVARAGGVGVVEAMRLGRPGYADGGAVLAAANYPALSGMARQRRDSVDVKVGIAADQNGNLQPFVESVAIKAVSAGIKHYDKNVAPGTAVKSVREHQMRGD